MENKFINEICKYCGVPEDIHGENHCGWFSAQSEPLLEDCEKASGRVLNEYEKEARYYRKKYNELRSLIGNVSDKIIKRFVQPK